MLAVKPCVAKLELFRFCHNDKTSQISFYQQEEKDNVSSLDKIIPKLVIQFYSLRI